MPGSQFKVSRTAYKDNSSKYFYNGKAMQFKDVAKLLRQVGIDLIHNRFLILQVVSSYLMVFARLLFFAGLANIFHRVKLSKSQ